MIRLFRIVVKGFDRTRSFFAFEGEIASLRGVVVVLLILIGTKAAYSDMGSVYLSDVNLSERAQTAIIMHNYDEEILILGTWITANKQTQILRFIPFPSEPKVSVPEGDIYYELEKLLNKRKVFFQEFTKSGSDIMEVEVRMSAKLSSHDITVIKINDAESFGMWATRFLKEVDPKGNVNEETLEYIKKIANDYIHRGYKYFVFDIVTVTKDSEPVKPLIFRFKTDKLYYPLKTSNSIGGKGIIQLVLILPGSLGVWVDNLGFYGYKELREAFGVAKLELGWNLSSSVKVSADELGHIYRDSQSFFHGIGHIYLQVFRVYSEYNFKSDFILDIRYIPTHKLVYVPASFGGYRNIEKYLQYMTAEELYDYVECYPELKRRLKRVIHYSSPQELYERVMDNFKLRTEVLRHISRRM